MAILSPALRAIPLPCAVSSPQPAIPWRRFWPVVDGRSHAPGAHCQPNARGVVPGDLPWTSSWTGKHLAARRQAVRCCPTRMAAAASRLSRAGGAIGVTPVRCWLCWQPLLPYVSTQAPSIANFGCIGFAWPLCATLVCCTGRISDCCQQRGPPPQLTALSSAPFAAIQLPDWPAVVHLDCGSCTPGVADCSRLRAFCDGRRMRSPRRLARRRGTCSRRRRLRTSTTPCLPAGEYGSSRRLPHSCMSRLTPVAALVMRRRSNRLVPTRWCAAASSLHRSEIVQIHRRSH